jgi:RNA polymerase sigma-70 factor (ECF subfamily)
LRPIMSLKKDLYNIDVKDNEETILVRAASRGDVDSFSRLCERYYSVIVAIAYSQISDRGLAEDAAQEAFFVAFRDISKLKKVSHFGRWLTKICRNI